MMASTSTGSPAKLGSRCGISLVGKAACIDQVNESTSKDMDMPNVGNWMLPSTRRNDVSLKTTYKLLTGTMTGLPGSGCGECFSQTNTRRVPPGPAAKTRRVFGT